LSNNSEIPSQIAIYNPISEKLYFRGVSISGRQIFNFSDRPRLLAGTVHVHIEQYLEYWFPSEYAGKGVGYLFTTMHVY
jgi:hypothetical protein